MDKLIPIFAGYTPDADGELIVLYQCDAKATELYLQHSNGEIWALSPGAEVVYWYEDSQFAHISIQSPEWSGSAIGSKVEIEPFSERG